MERGWHSRPSERPTAPEFLYQVLKEFNPNQEDEDEDEQDKEAFLLRNTKELDKKEQELALSQLSKLLVSPKEEKKNTLLIFNKEKEKEQEKEQENKEQQKKQETEKEREKEKGKEENEEKGGMKRISLDSRERCQSVEEVKVVEVKDAEKYGKILCLVAARNVFADSPSWNPLKKRKQFVVVGGTSRGFLIAWNEQVFYFPFFKNIFL